MSADLSLQNLLESMSE